METILLTSSSRQNDCRVIFPQHYKMKLDFVTLNQKFDDDDDDDDNDDDDDV